MGDYRPRRNEYNACGPGSFLNELSRHPTCKIEVAFVSTFPKKKHAAYFSVKVKRMAMQSGYIYI
jgi:hypothetical protein